MGSEAVVVADVVPVADVGVPQWQLGWFLKYWKYYR